MNTTNQPREVNGSFAEKRTRTCQHCRQVKDKYTQFYAPTDHVCIVCNPEVNFIKKMRRLGREEGLEALRDKVKDYLRRARLTRKVMRDLNVR